MYKILRSHTTIADAYTRPGRYVLVERGDTYEPFVTAWLGDGDTQWCWGHYFDVIEDANRDFVQRTMRG